MDDEVQEVIEQVTRRKLSYARVLLRGSKLPYSGNRDQIRDRLMEAVKANKISLAILKDLLNELDVWGNQRIRLCRLPAEVLAEYQTEESVLKKAEEAGMGVLMGGEVALVPPLELMPMAISYEEQHGQRWLKLFAAKTRKVFEYQPNVPEHEHDDHPGVVFKPFKLESQKAVSFAEINLASGMSLFSTTLLRRGTAYHAEFEEFFAVFEPLIPLHRADPIPLFEANRGICGLPSAVVRLVSRRARTSTGGKLEARSHSAKTDMRTDVELETYFPSGSDTMGLHCNCVWEPSEELDEPLHTHVYAPQAEISIPAQSTEANVRHVLHRILELN